MEMAQSLSTCYPSMRTGVQIPRNPHKCQMGIVATGASWLARLALSVSSRLERDLVPMN